MIQETENQLNTPAYNKVNFFILVKGGASAFIKFVENVFDAHENRKARTPDKDGTLIHAEIQIADSMILVADSKDDWPFTPAFPQVYVDNAEEILEKAEKNGAVIITEVSDFYGGQKIARFKDPWQNIWWLFAKNESTQNVKETQEVNTDWHDKKPGYIYTTIMDAMRNLRKEIE
ncbi:VOC family protein [Spirosoma sp.]|uniref:VOC family protein n=1 Tax=Spirosoma sp. TaxID=1899569 RepID=UPI003B3BB268